MIFGRDSFVDKEFANSPEFTPGVWVGFNAFINDKVGNKGQPNALSVQLCDESWEPEPGDLSTSAELPGMNSPTALGVWNSMLAGKGPKGKGGKMGGKMGGMK